MKKFTLLLAMTIFSTMAFGSIDVQRRDMKLASQVLIEKQSIDNAVIALTTRLTTDQAVNSVAAVTITTFTANADVPRNITVTTGGTTADCKAANVTVTGTNFFGQTITDTLAITDNQNGTTSGTKAFASVTSVLIPAQDGDACVYDVGVGDVLGLKRCMDFAGHVVMAVFDGVYEATRATCVADADEIEKNTCDINGTLNGAKDIELYFYQNFRCLP